MNSTLTLTQEWDKTFPQNETIDHCKVTFHNRFGIELAADLYKPKNAAGKLAAVAVSGPFGAVKEQSSGLYAQELAARGFLTVAFDPSYTGESGGTPRYVASPDINTEDFSAAVDFLSVRDDVNPERIGILGICGWGGMALNAAAIDTRIKATVTSTMYDMTRVTANGYFDTDDNPDARYALRQALNAQTDAAKPAERNCFVQPCSFRFRRKCLQPSGILTYPPSGGFTVTDSRGFAPSFPLPPEAAKAAQCTVVFSV